MADKDILAEEIEAFETAYDFEADNRMVALEDLRFARMSEQWPEKIKKQREEENRPVLTINKMPAFIRQVVNDGRQNRPQIKVKPVDDDADTDTAKILEGLIRNIEYESKADVAYDTALDNACSCGWGYVRVAIEYDHDGTFDRSLRIQRIANPFTVYGDPNSTAADSSDWNRAFVTEYMSRDEFKRKYKGAEEVDWTGYGYDALEAPWREDNQILTAESWKREVVKKKILLLSDGQIMDAKTYEQNQDLFMALGIAPVQDREADGYKITHYVMSGAEILETNEWAGKYIPIIPFYGEEINIEGKRYFRSLIHNAKDAQRMFNYWRTTATEMVALSPKVPFIGEEDAFDVDPNWATANTASHPYLMFKKGAQMPSRQPMDSGQAVGAMSEAMAANDDMKAIIGMYDASLGQRSNETSGVAINARKQEGDVSTFHYIDNQARGISHVGSVLIDLIPKVYSGERVVRILGEDGSEQRVKIGQQQGGEQPENPMMDQIEDIAKIYDISTGRYDVAVSTGPGYTTKREQAAVQMTEFVRAFPAAMPVIGDLLVKALDWPQAEDIAERLKSMMPQQAQGGLPPELQKILEGMKQNIEKLSKENEQLKTKAEIEAQKLKAEAYKAETDRLTALLPYMTPESLAQLGLQMNVQAINTPDIAPGGAPPQETNSWPQ